MLEISTQVAPVSQAGSDEDAIRLWLNRYSSPNTARAYAFEVARFTDLVGKPLRLITVADLQSWMEDLSATLSPASLGRAVATIKSLFHLLQRIGYLQYNAAAVIDKPPARDTLADRILTVEEVQRLIAAALPGRNRTLIRLLYATAVRLAECLSCRLDDLAGGHEKGGYLTVYGKGGKTRTVVLPNPLYADIMSACTPHCYLFPSRKGSQPIDDTTARDIVRDAAIAARIDKPVSPHWLRHSHASHALDAGATIAVVQQTLGHSNIATTGRYLHARPSTSSSLYISA